MAYIVRAFDPRDTSARPRVFSSLESAKQKAVWITRGVNGDQPATPVLLGDCTTTHLRAILANKPLLSDDYRTIIEAILKDRTPRIALVGVILANGNIIIGVR